MKAHETIYENKSSFTNTTIQNPKNNNPKPHLETKIKKICQNTTIKH